MAFSAAFEPNLVATLEEGVAFGDGFGDGFEADTALDEGLAFGDGFSDSFYAEPTALEEGSPFSDSFDASFDGGADTVTPVEPVNPDDRFIFDGPTKRIHLNGVTEIEAIELYSAWKIWVLDNPQWLPAFRTIGGDPTIQGQFAPSYYFLTYGWRIIVDGVDATFKTNLYTEEGDTPTITLNGGTAQILNSDVGQIGATDIEIDASQINIDSTQIATDVAAAVAANQTEPDYTALADMLALRVSENQVQVDLQAIADAVAAKMAETQVEVDPAIIAEAVWSYRR